ALNEFMAKERSIRRFGIDRFTPPGATAKPDNDYVWPMVRLSGHISYNGQRLSNEQRAWHCHHAGSSNHGFEKIPARKRKHSSTTHNLTHKTRGAQNLFRLSQYNPHLLSNHVLILITLMA